MQSSNISDVQLGNDWHAVRLLHTGHLSGEVGGPAADIPVGLLLAELAEPASKYSDAHWSAAGCAAWNSVAHAALVAAAGRSFT